jgi:hypothetical protein
MKRKADAPEPMKLKKTLKSVTGTTGVSERSVGRTVKEMKTRESGAWTPFATLHNERVVARPVPALNNFHEYTVRKNILFLKMTCC